MKKLTKDKFGFFLLVFNILLLAGSIGYFSYSLILLQSIETLLRIGIIIFFIFLSIVCIVSIIKNSFRRKKLKIVITTVIVIIFSSIITVIGYNVNKIYSAIASITTNSQSYSASLVTLSNSSIDSIDDIVGEKIGMLSDKESVDGYQIPQEIISESNLSNEIVEYNNYLDLINALLDKDVNVIFLPTNYSILFATIDGFENLGQSTKIIYTKDKNVKIQKTLATKNLSEPFTVLLMGVDSENEDIQGSSFNGDSLVLITFNPNTLNATILSIPRDTYTSISCFAGQKKNKITHAAWYGESCMMSTIEKMFDVDIDYYVKINFKGVVKIVDSLGGVDVDVPYSFCEQNSNREFGNSTIYVREGYQTLNGEQALALARNRHPWTEYCSKEWTNYNSNDFVRGQNQQLVIQAMLNKLKNVNSVDTFYNMLNSISNSMETNMSMENILSFYNIAKDILIKSSNSTGDLSNLIGFQRLYLSGYDKMIVDYDSINDSGSKLSLYNFVPYQGSIDDISKAMKINLELIEDNPIKEFSFDINKPYEEKIIGKGYYNESSISLLPSFVGKSLSEVQSYCSARGITLNVEKVKTISSSFDGLVATQSLPSGMDVAFVSKTKGLTVSVYEYESDSKKNDSTNGTSTDNTNNNSDNDSDTTDTNNIEPVPGSPTDDISNTPSNDNKKTTDNSNDSSSNEKISSNDSNDAEKETL